MTNNSAEMERLESYAERAFRYAQSLAVARCNGLKEAVTDYEDDIVILADAIITTRSR